MKLRDYQEKAVTRAAQALVASKRTIIVAPTASGKSIIQAELVRRILRRHPTKRVLVLCHQGHLLTQNEDKIHELEPSMLMKTGIYCAQEKRKETKKQVILASRDSLGRDPKKCGKFSFVIVDEAHLVDVRAGTDESDTYYSRIFKHLGEDVMIIGLTGTPWRLSGGNVYGEGKFFQTLAYEIKMSLLMDRGYLCKYTLPTGVKKIIDTSNLTIGRTNDFTTKDLESVSSTDVIVDECIAQWLEHAKDRKTSLFFCCSIDHAKLVEKRLNMVINDSSKIAYIDGTLTGDRRRELLKKLTDGNFRVVINVGVLTTGFDAPIIDCIVMLRATASVALFIQMAGRGLRIHPDKEDCLMLDMAGNFERFGSLENPIVPEEKTSEQKRKEKEEKQEAERKERQCQSCGDIMPRNTRVCLNCGYVPANHTDTPFTLEPRDLDIASTHLMERTTRAGDQAIVATYQAAAGVFYTEWLLIGKNFRGQARAISRHKQLADPGKKLTKIRVTPNLANPKFPKIDLLEWTDRDPEDCPHNSVEMVISDRTGQKTVFCNDCEAIL